MRTNDPAYTLSRARLMMQSAAGRYSRALAAYEAARAELQEAQRDCDNASRDYDLALAASLRSTLTK